MAAVQHRPQTHLRRPSPFSSHYRPTTGLNSATANVSDSDSDDEPPPAIKFSKVTEALLNERNIPSSPIKYDISNERPLRLVAKKLQLETPSKTGIKIVRKSSPNALRGEGRRGSTPPRIVHLGASQTGSARRTISISGPYPQNLATRRDPISSLDVATPAQRVTSRSRASSIASQDGHAHLASSSSRPGSRNATRESSDPVAVVPERADVSRIAPSTINRARNATDLPPASQRVKRGPIATGTFLKSGPMRRGFRRRESEDNVSPTDEYNAPQSGSSVYTPNHVSSRSDGIHSRNDSANTRATSVEPVSIHDFAHEKHASSSRPSSRQGQQSSISNRLQSRHEQQDIPQRQSSIEPVHQSSHRASEQARSILSHHQSIEHNSGTTVGDRNHLGINSHNEATDDQENVPPPTFKRNKDQEFKFLGREPISHDKPDRSPLPMQQQIERKPLASMSNNLPHRPAPPPPPKMTVLETATATAGASTTKSRKKRTHVVLNGKIFTQMGKIGRGGSSDVYCVMAENFKLFAMKKVKLEDCDESAVRGYKGEIDLLNKLTNVERVIRLYDWELNEEKQELNVLMEKGDADLNRLLNTKINVDDAKFDGAFTRYHWKEMLECVQAVHEHDIVHSDLKPANFLVVQGRLKLIDFGIANAIDTDNTCNVHRDSHVGTPNYMSPESINDTNAATPGFSNSVDAQGRPMKKDMRMGKPSDVWSLGCILYQMTYGRPPFAHIANQMARILAITNPKHNIEFPDTGLGGVRIPSALKRTLRRCLLREADLRPTIPELLSDSDEFLNTEANGALMIRQEVLDQIISKVVDRCRDTRRGFPTQSEVAQYAPSFMLKIREMAEKA